jgi:hypothetical protein
MGTARKKCLCVGARTKFWHRVEKCWCVSARAKFWHRVEKCWCAGVRDKFNIVRCAYT